MCMNVRLFPQGKSTPESETKNPVTAMKPDVDVVASHVLSHVEVHFSRITGCPCHSLSIYRSSRGLGGGRVDGETEGHDPHNEHYGKSLFSTQQHQRFIGIAATPTHSDTWS
ncbi:hypothetical protein PM082_015233 [Marasmius tenuissimus]|nr:hypothetical protein PM082_015233 [Marasmius tenuissimus]